MALPNLLPFKNKNKSEPEMYYAVEISDESTKVAVWRVFENQIEVLRSSEIININGNQLENYPKAVDMAIATVIREGEQDPVKVIFGLPEEWVNESGIVNSRRGLLKYICDRLELKAIGFVVVADALISYLKDKQGTPPSAIFIRFAEKKLFIYLVKLGKIEKKEIIGRSNDLILDVKEGLSRFKSQSDLPSRIILYDGYLDFEDIKQQLLAYDFEKEFAFLQTPQIESLPKNASVEAVAIAGGKEAVKLWGIDKINQTSSIRTNYPAKEEIETTSSDLPEGFSEGIEEKISQPEIAVNDFQAPVDQTPKLVDSQNQEIKTSTQEISNFDDIDNQSQLVEKPKKSILAFLPKIKLPFFKKNKNQVPDLESPEIPIENEVIDQDFSAKKFKLPFWAIIIIIIVLLLSSGAGVFALYWNLPKAIVDINIKSETIEQEVDLIIARDLTTIDESNFIIPGKFEEASISGSQTVPTTGTKKVGESASGKVTIYNKTSSEKTFDKGTILVGSGNLRYILDENIKVASSSTTTSGNTETKTFGEAEVAISAGGIGEEYNLAVGKDFTFKDYNSDNYVAKNKAEISGGKSKQVQVVSKQDRLDALENLQKKLEAEALIKISQTIGNDRMVIDNTFSSEIINESFDKKVDEESNALIVTGDLQTQVLAVTKKDFEYILMRALSAKIPQEYQVNSQGLQSEIVTVEPVKDDKQKTSIKIKAKVKLVPKFDFTKIKSDLKGRNLDEAQKYIESLPNYASKNIILSPKILVKLAKMPQKADNISINIKEMN